MDVFTRRSILGAIPMLSAAPSLARSLNDLPATAPDPAEAARDESFWQAVRGLYDVTSEMIHLEHGNWGMMARPVLDAHKAALEEVNARTAIYARTRFGADARAVLQQTAAALGAGEDEIVFTRNATEAMQALISGYNRLRDGDGVLFADLDYPSMQTAMGWLSRRRGARVHTITLPEPASRQSVLDAYAAALEANPHIRLVLVTHVSHRTGLLLPVRELVELARDHGADVLVDSAHAFGQVDFDVNTLGADFIGLNLHKWIGAPLGVGAIYIRRERIGDIDPYMNAADPAPQGIRARVHTGTVNLAALLAVPHALAIHDRLGPARKAARLRHLRSAWAEALRDHPAIDVLTPADPALHAGITSFRLRGQTSVEDNAALAARLAEEFGIFTVMRDGLASGACVRVTPAVFTQDHEIGALVAALRRIVHS
ncbi:aminotransferase class V-fold PLP-dependent enzyme [Glycocaulis alkaliphilus]|nr:aminotransferase class V-fold PLP-dependent enzyme [Glycocaulis alkaliphilus]GGB83325.1 isopenicillin-N epimerase [Glycocaulis alkaliphilus]